MSKHIGWVASLSSGETVFEKPARDMETGAFIGPVLGKGELSPWQALLQRCQVENIRITQLRLQRGGVTVVGMPEARGYFQAYEARTSGRTLTTATLQGIGSIVGDLVVITWLNDQGHVWQDVRPLADMWVHTDRRQLADVI